MYSSMAELIRARERCKGLSSLFALQHARDSKMRYRCTHPPCHPRSKPTCPPLALASGQCIHLCIDTRLLLLVRISRPYDRFRPSRNPGLMHLFSAVSSWYHRIMHESDVSVLSHVPFFIALATRLLPYLPAPACTAFHFGAPISCSSLRELQGRYIDTYAPREWTIERISLPTLTGSPSSFRSLRILHEYRKDRETELNCPWLDTGMGISSIWKTLSGDISPHFYTNKVPSTRRLSPFISRVSNYF